MNISELTKISMAVSIAGIGGMIAVAFILSLIPIPG